MGTNDKSVAIIIPVYNGEKYLPQCLDSLINQDYKNIKIYIINDASKDNSVSVINEYIKKDSRISLINNTVNSGPSFARNCVLRKLDTDFFTFVDCDDWVEPNYVSTLVNMFDDSTVLTSCSYKFEKRSSKCFRDKVFEIKEFNINTAYGEVFSDKSIFGFVWNKMYKTENLQNVFFNEKMKICEDILFTLDYLLNCENGVVRYTTQRLYHYIKTKGSLSSLSCSTEKFYKQKPFFENLESYKNLPKLKENTEFCFKADAMLFLLSLQFTFYAKSVKLVNEKKYFKKLAKRYLPKFKKQKHIFKAPYRRYGNVLYVLIKIFL